MAATGPAHPQTHTVDEPRSEASSWLPSVAPERLAPTDPARYELVKEHARGGLGRILEVRDLRLGRVVALKEILASSDAAYARFVREALLTARLEHPAIVPVHDVGRWPSGEPFYSMKLVSGRTLHEVIHTTTSLAGRLGLLQNVIAVADAIAYAHSKGIIHRDLKPANVLVGEFGETVVIDWGLAKKLQGVDPELDVQPAPIGSDQSGRNVELDAPSLTVAGAVVGTACYMPPEQASGGAVDERADVYALGTLLYELLTGAQPYAGAADPVVAVLAGPPVAVEILERAIPPELGTIVRKAMARDLDKRYPSACELADDLRRFQTGRLVSVHLYSRRALAMRWLRRYRAVVAVALVALATIAVGGVVSVQRVIRERDVARRRADQLVLTQARGLIERDATQALAWLRSYPEDGEDQDARRALAIEATSYGVARHVPAPDGFFTFTSDGTGWIGASDGAHLGRYDVASGARTGWWAHPGQLESIVAVPDGRTLAVLDAGDTAVTLFDLETGRARRLPDHPTEVSTVAVSPDGRWIASASSDGLIRLEPRGAGTARWLTGHASQAIGLVFSRDGRWLFAVAPDHAVIRRWDLESDATRDLTGMRDTVATAVSADGALVALGHRDGEVSLWSAATGARVRTLGRHSGAANAVVFSPDAQWVASVGDDGALLVTSLTTGAQRSLAGRGAITGVAFSPDGALIATGGAAGEVHLWQVDGDEDRALGQHPGRVTRLAFSPDGRHLASKTTTAADAVNARIWDVATLGHRGLRCHRGAVLTLALSQDGQRMATGSEDAGICLWDLDTGEGHRLEGHEGTVSWVDLSRDGMHLASASYDGSVGLWNLTACASTRGCTPQPRILTGHRGPVWLVAMSADGRLVASAGNDGTVRLWDTTTGATRVLTGHTGAVRWVALSPDGRHVASAGDDHDVRVWDISTGTSVALHSAAYRTGRLAFSGDGRVLWSAGWDQILRRWDLATATARTAALQLGTVPVIAMSPDQRWLAAGDATGRVVLVDPDTLAVRVLGDNHSVVRRLAFSRDGTRIASAGHDHTVRLWDVGRAAMEAEFQTDFEVYNIAFSSDGRWIATVDSGAVVRIWPAPPRDAVPSQPWQLANWISAWSTVALGPRQHIP